MSDLKPGYIATDSGHVLPPAGPATAFPLRSPSARPYVQEIKTAVGHLQDQDERALVKDAEQRKLAEELGVGRYYQRRATWRMKSTAANDAGARFRAARARRIELEGNARAREREYRTIRPLQPSALAFEVMGEACALPADELLEIKRARELERDLSAEYERRLEASRSAGAVVSNCETFLKQNGVSLEELR